MIIERTSPISGKRNTMDLPITAAQMDSWLSSPTLIQDAFPNLNADQREFILTGILASEWDTMFNDDEPDLDPDDPDGELQESEN
jgi:hypothetical protein